jgi:Subtilase family/FG-GAP-like repeat
MLNIIKTAFRLSFMLANLALLFTSGLAQPVDYFKSDNATTAIRNSRNGLFRIPINSSADIQSAGRLGTIVENYGSFVVVSAANDTNFGQSEYKRLETTVNFPAKNIEPLNLANVSSLKTTNGRDYYVIQFGGIATDKWLNSLRDAGIEIVQYIPHQAFIVYSDSKSIKMAQKHSKVRWVGNYSGDDKISSELSEQISAALGKSLLRQDLSSLEVDKNGRSVFDIAIFSRESLPSVSQKIESIPNAKLRNKIDLPNSFFDILRVEMSLNDVSKVAMLSSVFRIDPYFAPRLEDERAAQIVAGNYLSNFSLSGPGYNPLSQFGVNGQNVTVSVVDDGVSIPGNGGFYVTSGNASNAPLRGAASGATGGHGHINASIIAGDTPFGTFDGLGYNYGLGVAPKANVLNIPLLVSGYTGTEANTLEDTVNSVGVNGQRGFISNNSWGAGTNGNSYDSLAGLYDGLVQDATTAGTIDPILVVFSAGNSGASGLTRPKMSKNTIATANAENIRTELVASVDNIDDLSNTSSRGPATDTRIKPDIAAPGTVITGSRAGTCGSVSSCFDGNHAYSSGTSHAAPQIVGVASLFTQWWRNQNAGTYPSPALVKAAIINTGREMNGNLTTAAIPNGNEGWGRVNMKFMLNTGVPMKYVNQTTDFLDVGNSSTITGKVADASKPIRVTLVWSDPPGTTNPALINDLDLNVTIGGSTYKGNVFSAGTSIIGGTADNRNNVENVWIPAGVAAGTPFSIQISASALNGNGILGNSDSTDQHFSLVAYNFADNGSKFVDFDGDGKTDISIFRPTLGQWWYLRSSDSANRAFSFGMSTDKIVPADYTGDGKTDIATFTPSTGFWNVLRSEDSTFYGFPFGTSGDIVTPADYDGDGKADAAVFRPSNSTWFISKSSGGTTIQQFGSAGDVPTVGDYDGDGKTDLAIYRVALGQWWYLRSSDGTNRAFTFGTSTDKPVQGDYTGDGKTDIAFFRPSTGFWFILRSEDATFFAYPFGTNSDIPTVGDYDGDGKFDSAVFRPSANTWYLNRSTSGVGIVGFGTTGDIPVPSAFVP